MRNTTQPSIKKSFQYLGAIGFTAIALLWNTNTFAQQDLTPTSDETISQQTHSITGTVYNKFDKTPLLGTAIMLKNTTRGVETDFDGEFTFDNVNVGDVLVIYSLGFLEKQVTITNTTKPLQIFLEEDSEMLDDVFLGDVDTNQHYKTKRNLWQKVKSIF